MVFSGSGDGSGNAIVWCSPVGLTGEGGGLTFAFSSKVFAVVSLVVNSVSRNERVPK
ncbi:hypothetical protein [Amycolatopsis japonica]|uniref:hypothetical protein n=1 Tax=Amycolatopsis japonica TaxID=208439 RepID=UPI000ACCF0E2